MRFVPSLAILFFTVCAVAEDAAGFREKGIAALKASQTDQPKIVDAARNFARASTLFEAAGKIELATEMNSYLYWCKKKMTAADMTRSSKTIPRPTA